MKNKLLFGLFVFFGIISIAFAEELNCDEKSLYTCVKPGVTCGVTSGVCDYYRLNPDKAGDNIFTLEVDNSCYVTHYIDDISNNPIKYYNGYMNGNTCETGEVSAMGTVSENIPVNDINGNVIEKNYLLQDNLNIAKLVREINKGSLAQTFKDKYNLSYIKAATVSAGNGELLVIQYIPKNSTMQTLKINYSRDKNNSILNSSIVVNDISTNLLGEFPFWILEAAPNYNQDKVSKSSKEALLAAFKDITNYKYSKNGTVYSVSASIPDDINPRVLAVYSNFLSENPLTAFAEEQAAASTEGQSTDQKTQNKVKNTKTGAFMSVKVIIIGLIVACIAGSFVYRYSKMKKI